MRIVGSILFAVIVAIAGCTEAGPALPDSDGHRAADGRGSSSNLVGTYRVAVSRVWRALKKELLPPDTADLVLDVKVQKDWTRYIKTIPSSEIPMQTLTGLLWFEKSYMKRPFKLAPFELEWDGSKLSPPYVGTVELDKGDSVLFDRIALSLWRDRANLGGDLTFTYFQGNYPQGIAENVELIKDAPP
jgi:hypothetical protein